MSVSFVRESIFNYLWRSQNLLVQLPNYFRAFVYLLWCVIGVFLAATGTKNNNNQANGEVYSHIVNVTALEGKFNVGKKSGGHPHTNMAKAALNMMTLTGARDYARTGILMNSVDTVRIPPPLLPEKDLYYLIYDYLSILPLMIYSLCSVLFSLVVMLC